MPRRPITYNTGSAPSGTTKKGKIDYGTASQNYGANYGGKTWYASLDDTNQYVIISDSYSLGYTTAANAKPIQWGTQELSTQNLLDVINGLPERKHQRPFGTVNEAVTWLNNNTNIEFDYDRGVSASSYDTIPTTNLQILIDFNNPSCYSGGSTFTNLVDSQRNNGYLKNNALLTTYNDRYLAIKTSGANNGVQNYVGDRIDINTSGSGVDRFSKDTNFSFCFWVNKHAGGRWFATGSAGSGNSDVCVWQFWIEDSTWYWWNPGGGGTDIISGSIGGFPTYNDWYFMVVTFESGGAGGTNYIRGYRDGVLQNTLPRAYNNHQAVDRTSQTNLQYTLGGGYYSSCYTRNSSNSFAIFACYNKTLSQSEITQFYNATRYRFDK